MVCMVSFLIFGWEKNVGLSCTQNCLNQNHLSCVKCLFSNDLWRGVNPASQTGYLC